MNRAYSVLHIKSIDEDERIIRGMATTPAVDRDGESIDPYGVTSAPDIPLCMFHDQKLVVGRAKLGRPTLEGIPFEAKIPHVKEAGRLRDRVDEAFQMAKYKLITGVSVGFIALRDAIERSKDGGIIFKAIEVLELSLVPIPANAEATIHSVKSIGEGMLAASGQAGRSPIPATGQITKGKTVELSAIQESIRTKQARMDEIGEAAKAANAWTAEQRGEFDTLDGEIGQLQDDERFAKMASRAGVVKGANLSQGSQSRGPAILVKHEDPEDQFKGQSYTRRIIAMAVAWENLKKGIFTTPGDVAAQRWGKSHPKLTQYIKAAVPGAGTGSGEWGAELAASDTKYTGDFIDFLYGATVFDRLNLRAVPARVHVKGADGAAVGYWVGESKHIPLTQASASSVELLNLKAATIAVASKELLFYSDPSGEQFIRDALVNAIAQEIDTTFLSADAAVAGVSPAGILNGVTAITPNGTTAADLRNDLQLLLAPFIANKMASGIALVVNPAMGLAIGSLTNALGQPEFSAVNQNGGTLAGMRVVVGDNVPADAIIAIREQDVWKIGDRGVDVSMSDTATIEMSDAPTGASDTPTNAGSPIVSMFQSESVAFKVVRPVNFQKRRAQAVQWIDGAGYGAAVT